MGGKDCYGYCPKCPQSSANNDKDYTNPRTDRPQGVCGMGTAHEVILKTQDGKIHSFRYRQRGR